MAFSAVFICVIYFAWPATAADKAAKGPKVTDKVTSIAGKISTGNFIIIRFPKSTEKIIF